ncbi:MAG: helix-turn-helix domain-containing protein [Blautia wexlerae]
MSISINSGAGKLIKEARKNKGLTQKQLAEKTGLAVVTIQQYERNLREPRLKNIIKIANALNVSPESLFGSIHIDITTEFDREKLDYCSPGIFSEGNIRYMSELLSQLNLAGQEKALEQVELLIKIPEYQKNYTDSEVLAAHARTDVEQTPEGIQHDLDIMNDDSEWK